MYSYAYTCWVLCSHLIELCTLYEHLNISTVVASCFVQAGSVGPADEEDDEDYGFGDVEDDEDDVDAPIYEGAAGVRPLLYRNYVFILLYA